MADAPEKQGGGLAGWLVLTQLRAAATLLAWLTRQSRMQDAGRIVERACRSALMKPFPLFAGRLGLLDQTALCARAVQGVDARQRPLVQSMMLLWLVRTRSYAAQLIDLESIDALRFAPDAPRQAAAKNEATSRAATMAGNR
jgi:hypothetical protein